ncbi:MAG: hypothetical protein KDC66_10925 [Phaeodactylibacter sp.]|nr:hypothetical protein [Phaeodactylibacter sp.]
MERLIILPVLALVLGQAFAQSDSPLDYEALMNAHRGLSEDFLQARERLDAAATEYTAVIRNIFASEEGVQQGPAVSATKHRQQQLEKMIYLVPVLTASAEDKQSMYERIELWVSGFSKEFGLNYEQEKPIRQSLMDYAKAYGKYQAIFNKLQEAVNNGRPLPPAVPPLPPPPQQHHNG